jgi:predicted AlkP superfamily pyrophosphatase or phosphodiesterase
MKKFIFLLLVWFVVPGIPLKAQKNPVPYVIMISFDGFRYDYVKNFNPPNFKAFIKKGSQAEAMIPSFPSKTFPNHYTLVTGLTPGHHGLVDNSFYDRTRKTTYGMRDQEKVIDPYYYGGVPLWQLAREHGIKSASYFWVGSEMNVEERRPDYYFPFNDKVEPQHRVDQVVAWLNLPEKERPHFITLYFSFPDHEGHNHGPRSEEVRQAVLRADTLLGNLMKSLETVKLPVNVIVVSDHGMHELIAKPDTYISTNELINKKDTSIIVVNGSTQAHLYVADLAKRDSVYKSLKSKEKGFRIYKRDEFPERWDYKTDRTGDLLLEADNDHYIREGAWNNLLEASRLGNMFGVHGYDPENLADVRGIFYAQGPNIRQGMVIPAFQNIHVYPLIAKILGLPLPAIDGKEEILHDLYKKK